jgi:hypothetical protein
MSYAAAHKWEKLAASRGVSAVARSTRGFMRAYQKAGTWARLPDAWKRKRDAFIARHMAQGKSERLWKDGKPSRRALALIMWAYMPPRKNPQPASLHKTNKKNIFVSKNLVAGMGKRVVKIVGSKVTPISPYFWGDDPPQLFATWMKDHGLRLVGTWIL